MKPFWGLLRATLRRLCVLESGILYIFFWAQIAISLVFYKEVLHFLERFWGLIFYVFAGVEFITIFSCSV